MSYLRLKNITLGYTLPQNILRKVYIQNLRVYASVDNLWLLHKGNGNIPLDPEINTGEGLNYGGWAVRCLSRAHGLLAYSLHSKSNDLKSMLP